MTREYETYANVVISKQLTRAGARLALLLDSILSNSSDFPKQIGQSPLRQLVEQVNTVTRPKDEL